jgi:hypothetical protein
MPLETTARLACLTALGASASLLAGYALAQVVADDILAAPHHRRPAPRAAEDGGDLLRAIERGARLRMEEQGEAQAAGSSRL